MNTLYIFSTSFNPDVYINAIVHYLNIETSGRTNIEVITMFEDAVEMNKFENKYKNTIEKIETVLDNLGQGKYHTTDGNRNVRLVQLDEDDKSFYGSSKSNINGRIISRPILYTDLEKKILSIINDVNNKFIFDLSGERKYLLVDILFISLANNCRELYVFDILREQDFNFKKKNLIHNLARNEYKFRNLFSTKYVKESINKLSQNKDIEILNIKNTSLSIIDYSADKFAKCSLFVLLIFVIFILYTFLKYSQVIKDDWNAIEPKTFIYVSVALPISYFIISIIIVLLFTKELEFTPKGLYNSIKKYKLNQLKNNFNVL